MFRYVLIILLLSTTCFSFDKNYSSLEKILKRVLKIEPPAAELGLSKNDVTVPSHMMELYRKYTSMKKPTAETILSITPIEDISHLGLKDMLVFNLSYVSSDEEVRLSQLLLHRRRLSRHPHPLHPKLLAPPYRVRVFQVISPSVGRLRTVPLANVAVSQVSRGGWQSLDITSAIRELFLGFRNIPLILGVRFEAPRAQIVSPNHFLDHKHNSSAYLMIYTRENSENDVIKAEKISDLEHLRGIVELTEKSKENRIKKRHHSHHSKTSDVDTSKPRRHKHKTVHEGDSDIKELIAMKRVKKLRRHKKLFKELYDRNLLDKSHIESNFINELLESEEGKHLRNTRKKSHRRRSIYDNEVSHKKLHLVEDTTTIIPHILSAPEDSETKEDEEGPLIPFPPGMERKRKRRGHRSHRNRESELREDISSNLVFRHFLHTQNNSADNSTNNTTCSVHKLYVDFEKIGWNDWIIAPNGFNANYCSGTCNTMTTETFSYHGHVMEMMHLLDKTIPGPCCAPRKLISTLVLYLHSTQEIILKSLPAMEARSCVCL